MTSLPETSLAAVFHSPGRPFELAHVPLPILEPGEAIVKVECCTICGSDLHSIAGRRNVPAPTILGHEIVGTVAQVGPGHRAGRWMANRFNPAIASPGPSPPPVAPVQPAAAESPRSASDW